MINKFYRDRLMCFTCISATQLDVNHYLDSTLQLENEETIIYYSWVTTHYRDEYL